MCKVLFIVKKRLAYGSHSKSYGLVNSCQFISNSLEESGIKSKCVIVTDNNDIDREVTTYRPTHCFIEALWVVPEKFEILSLLHPNVHWIIRLHSEIPFLASEGIAMEWIRKYNQLRRKGISISLSSNSKEGCNQLKHIYGIHSVVYTPNVYNPRYTHKKDVFKESEIRGDVIHIGCFGAFRLLKNHLQQAVWAIQFADKHNKKLIFHVNSSEHENNKESNQIMRNMKELFINSYHTLKIHPWKEHKEFLDLVKSMDLGMQISFTETFNIVAADFVHCNVPIVVSPEVDWACPLYMADPSNTDSVIFTMEMAYFCDVVKLQRLNKFYLNCHNKRSLHHWLEMLQSPICEID